MTRALISCTFLLVLGTAVRGDELPAGAVRRFGDPTLRVHPYYEPTLSPDGKFVAYRADRDVLRVADPLTGKVVRDFVVPKGTKLGGYWHFLGSTGDRFYVLYPVENVYVYDAKAAKVVATIPFKESFARFTASDDGRVGIMWTGYKDDITLWDMGTGKQLGKLAHGLTEFVEAALSGDGTTALVVGAAFAKEGNDFKRTDKLQMWDVKTAKLVREVVCDKLPRLPALSHDGKLIAANPVNTGATEVRDAATGKVLLTIPEVRDIYFGFTRPYHFSPDGKRLAIRYDRGVVRLWDLAAKKEIGETRAAVQTVVGVGFDADGNAVACGRYGAAVVGWKTPGPNPPKPTGHFGPVTALRFTPDGKELVSAAPDRRVLRWEVATGKPLGTVYEEEYRPFTGTADQDALMTFSPDGRYLFRSYENQGEVIDLRAGKPLPKLTARTEYTPPTQKALFAPDSSKLLCCGSTVERTKTGFDNLATACVWSLPDCKLLTDDRKKVDKLSELVPTAEALLKVKHADSFPAAGPLEVVVSERETDPWTHWSVTFGRPLAVRDTKAGQTVLELDTRMYHERAFALSPDGKRLAVGWNDTTVLLFDVPAKK